MPHGRPEEGVKKTGFALVTLKKPLEFNPCCIALFAAKASMKCVS